MQEYKFHYKISKSFHNYVRQIFKRLVESTSSYSKKFKNLPKLNRRSIPSKLTVSLIQDEIMQHAVPASLLLYPIQIRKRQSSHATASSHAVPVSDLIIFPRSSVCSYSAEVESAPLTREQTRLSSSAAGILYTYPPQSFVCPAPRG